MKQYDITVLLTFELATMIQANIQGTWPKCQSNWRWANIITTRPQNNVEAINQSALVSQTNHPFIHPYPSGSWPSNHTITQSLRRIARTTTIFQLSGQKFEHMMIIDDKSSQPPQESQMVCRNVQINRTIVRPSVESSFSGGFRAIYYGHRN